MPVGRGNGMSPAPTTGLYRLDENTIQIRVQGEPKATVTTTGITGEFDLDAIATAVLAAVTIDEIPGTLLAAQLPALDGVIVTTTGDATTSFAADVVDNTALSNMAAHTVKANPTASTADPQDATLNATLEFSGTALQRAALTGDVTAPAGSNTTTLAAGSASNLNSGTLPAGRMPALTGDVTTSAGAVATTIASHAVTLGKMAQLAGSSLMGNPTATDPNDVAAIPLNVTLEFNSGQIRRAALTGDVTSSAGSNATTLAAGSASNLNSGTLPAGRMPALTGDVTTSAGAVATTIANNAVTYAKMQDVSATARLIGRATAGSGDPEEISLNSTLSFTGTSLQRAALTGDITASAGSNATTLAAGSASNLNSGTLPAGRMPALTGDVTTSAGAVATTIANDAVTYAKMQNVSATDKVLGRKTAGSGDVEELDCTPVARTLIQQTTVPLMRTAGLGLDTMATQAASAVSITGGTIAGTDLTSTTNDLGSAAGGAGAKGRTIMWRGIADHTGNLGDTAVGSDYEGHYMDSPPSPVTPACKVTKAVVNVVHQNASNPGTWTLVVHNATSGGTCTLSCTMATLGGGNNITIGNMSSQLAFASGDIYRIYMTGPACDGVAFSAWIYLATT